MNGLIRIPATVFALALFASAQSHAEDAIFSVGEPNVDRVHWQSYTTNLSDQEYRNVYKYNQKRIRKFVTSYSRNTLLSMGVPEYGVKFIGVAAGLAANRNATLYLNKSRFLALEFKDVVNDNRAMFLGIKMDW